MKKLLALLLAAGMCAGFASCGGSKTPTTYTDSERGETYTLTIFRSRDAGMTDGDRDEAVKAAIEEKFWKDTGISISLDVRLYTNNDLSDVVDVNYNNKNTNIDAVVHYLSDDTGSAIAKYAKDVNSVVDLDPVLQQYGTHILEKIQENDTDHLADRAGYFSTDGEYHRTALSSYAKEGGFGIIMRKDLMRNVEGTTGLRADDYDINNPDYKSMTVSEFRRVMEAIKNDPSNDVTTPVNGMPWDIGRVIAPAFGVDAMSAYGLDENGKFVPAQFTPNWEKYVDLMYTWSKDGIWESESNNTTDDQRKTNFIAGLCAAYIAYPTAEELIDLSKKFYAANTGSEELMVIAPFAGEDDEGRALLDENGKQIVNGNLKTTRGFYGMIVPFRSANYEKLIQYIDWMYSSTENYELCQYGVKGVDWVEGEDFSYNGINYKTWAYPDNKADEYLMKPPYTGKYMLLPNINVSNRISAHYNTVEKVWYTSLYFDFPKYGNTETEAIWIPETPRMYAMQDTTLEGEYVENIRSYAWVGRKNGTKTPMELLQEYITEMKSECAEYLNYIDTEYQKAKAYFAEKYGK